MNVVADLLKIVIVFSVLMLSVSILKRGEVSKPASFCDKPCV